MTRTVAVQITNPDKVLWPGEGLTKRDLVEYYALASGQSISLDARLVRMAAAGIALWRKAPILVVIVVAAAATALTRLFV